VHSRSSRNSCSRCGSGGRHEDGEANSDERDLTGRGMQTLWCAPETAGCGHETLAEASKA
jgi:hypothetical protein